MPDILLIMPRSKRIARYNALGYLAAALKSPGFMERCRPNFTHPLRDKVPTSPFDVKILDLSIAPRGFDIEQYIGDTRPLIVGSTSFFHLRRQAYEIGRITRQVSPYSFRVIGGWDASPRPEETLKESEFEMVFRGEAEESLVEVATLLRCAGLEGLHENLRLIQGHSSKGSDGSAVGTGHHVPKVNLDDYPFSYLGFESLLFDRYESEMDRNGADLWTGFIIGSRGCVYNCIYCAHRSHYAEVLRTRSPENILQEINEDLLPRGVRYVHFWDENFTIPRSRALLIAKGISAIRARGIDLTWGCQATGDSLDEELMDVMERSGLSSISFGIESGDPVQSRTLKGREVDFTACEKATRRLAKYGFGVMHYYLFNTPGETWQAVFNSNRFKQRSRPSKTSSLWLQDFPGCRSQGMARGLTVQEAEHASYLFAGTPINFSGNNPAHIMMQNELVFCVFCDLMIRSIAGYSDTGRPEIISGLRKSAPKGSFLSRYFCFLEDKRRFAVYQKLEGDRDLLLKILSDGTEGEAGFLVNFGLPDFLEDFSFGIFHPDFLSNINVRTEAEFPVDMTAEGLVKLFFACDLLWGLGDKSPKDPWAIRLSIKSESVRHFRAAVDALSASELKFELRSRLLKDQDKKTFEYEKEGIRFSVSFEERSIIIEYD